MLHILLLILKIIGIILLVILGLVLLTLCCVIFIPIRYHFDTKYFGRPVLFARVSWLLRMVCVKVSYETDFHFVIQLFGITIIDNKKPKKKKVKKTKKVKEKVKTEKSERVPSADVDEKKQALALEDNVVTDTVSPTDTVSSKETFNKETAEKSKKSISQSLKKVYDKIIEKVKSLYKKIVSLFENIQAKKDNIIDKLTHINEKKDAILDILLADANRSSFVKVKSTLFKMLGSLLPRKIRAEVSFGFEDPATTGYVLGIAGMFYPVYDKSVSLRPNFQNKVLEGWIKGWGRIRIFAFVKAAAILILDKKIRSIAMDFKKVFK